MNNPTAQQNEYQQDRLRLQYAAESYWEPEVVDRKFNFNFHDGQEDYRDYLLAKAKNPSLTLDRDKNPQAYEYHFRLANGANHFNLKGIKELVGDPHNYGMTQTTDQDINAFARQYEIIDHLPNTASGFSVTLIQDRNSKQVYMSARSTEFKPSLKGGDTERDGVGAADGEISKHGLAFAQLADAERYYQDILKGVTATKPDGSVNDGSYQDPKLTSYFKNGGDIEMTGYSLSAHIALVMKMRHPERISEVYNINAPGIGAIDNAPPNQASINSVMNTYTNMMQYANKPFDFEPSKHPEWFKQLGEEDRYKALDAMHQSNQHGPYNNIYQNPLHQYAVAHLSHRTRGAGSGEPQQEELIALGAQAAKDTAFRKLDPLGLTPIGQNETLPNADETRELEKALKKGDMDETVHVLHGYMQRTGIRIDKVLDGIGAANTQSMIDNYVAGKGLVSTVEPRYEIKVPGVQSYAGLGATGVDAKSVADSGYHTKSTAVPIENQALAWGTLSLVAGVGDFGDTHSMTLVQDTLKTQALFQKLDPSFNNTKMQTVMRASDDENAKISAVEVEKLRQETSKQISQMLQEAPIKSALGAGAATYFLDQPSAQFLSRALTGAALPKDIKVTMPDPSSLENMTEAMGKLVLNKDYQLTVDKEGHGAGNLKNRNALHNVIAQIDAGIDKFVQTHPNTRIHIISQSSSVDLAEKAKQDTPEGLAYRYALAKGNPFVVVDPSGDLYKQHNKHHELDLNNPAKNQRGAWTQHDVEQRAEALTQAFKDANQNTRPKDDLQVYQVMPATDMNIALTVEDLRQRNVAKGLSPNGYSLEEVNIIKKSGQEDIRIFAQKDAKTGGFHESAITKTSTGFHVEEKFYDNTGRHPTKSTLEITDKLYQVSVYDPLGNQKTVLFEPKDKDRWGLVSFTQNNAKEDGSIKETWQAQGAYKIGGELMQDVRAKDLHGVADKLAALPTSPRGIPLGVTGITQTLSDGTAITASAERLNDGRMIERTWHKVGQDMSNKTDIYHANGSISKTISSHYDASERLSSATVNLHNKQGELTHHAQYQEVSPNQWQLKYVSDNNGHSLQGKALEEFAKANPPHEILELSTIKKPSLSFDQLPENVRTAVDKIKDHPVTAQLQNMGWSKEEIDNAHVALATATCSMRGSQPKQIITVQYIEHSKTVDVVTPLQTAFIPLETARTQSFEQSMAKMEQTLTQQAQQQNMAQQQSQGQALSIGGHRMV